MEGRNVGGERTEVSTGFSSNSHFYKSMRRMGMQEGRGLMLADALLREREGEKRKGKGGEEKVKNIM